MDDKDNIGRDVEEEKRKRVVINNAAEEDDDDNSDSPNLIALVSCKFPWNLVIEAMKIGMLNADSSVAGLKSRKY